MFKLKKYQSISIYMTSSYIVISDWVAGKSNEFPQKSFPIKALTGQLKGV